MDNTFNQFGKDCDDALGWIARFRSDSASEDDRNAFALWLTQDEHRVAMDQMLDLWEDTSVLSVMPFDTTLETPAANQRRWFVSAAVAAAACLVVAVALWPLSPVETPTQYYQTAKGERQTFELNDTSTVALNTDSRIAVSYSDEERYIELIRGEAFFKVASNPERPFHVDAGVARTTVVGTAFNVYRSDSETVDITVVEGVVKVTELGNSGSRMPASDVLTANHHLIADRNGLNAQAQVDASKQLAWQRGEIMAEELPLHELVHQIERYSDLHILLGDRELAMLSVSGVFRVDQPDVILTALERSLNVRIIQIDDSTVQLLKSDQ
ncbi:MAG: FecR domain-containing protein [Halioglobus sp.]